MRAASILIGAAAFALLGCSTHKDVAVRPVGAPPLGSGADRVAYANGQLAIGNVALALEAFRRASRENPADAAALVGMAACYDRMGRFDLSRKHYEAALARAPADSAILARLAVSMDLAGVPGEAAKVRREIAQRASRVVTVLLPEAAPAQASAPLATPDEVTSSAAIATASRAAPERDGGGPRLERLSFGEVALVTAPGPRWGTPHSATAASESAPARIRLLNAARHQGLAARTRNHLSEQGWRRLAIGNAPTSLTRSVILYPANRRPLAERLGRELGITILRQNRTPEIVMLLGRDLSARRRVANP